MSHKLLTSSVLSIAALLFLTPATSMAQDAPPPGYYAPQPYAPQPYPPQGYAPQGYTAQPAPGYHEHDGFYLRCLLGLGYLHNSASSSGSSISVSGVGGTFGLAIGGVVAPNLVIYGELLGTSVSDPTVDDGTNSATASGLTTTLAGFGPGVAYYLDGNMYLSGALLFTRISFSDSSTNEQLGSTNLGFGAGLTFGKEWWVSTDWGLGVSGQLMFASMKENGADYRWTSVAASLLFSATYN